jgi:hypothetical protein
MPEAAVDKNSYFDAGEYQICVTSYACEWSLTYPISQPEGVRGSADSELGFCVPETISLHRLAYRRARCPTWALHLPRLCRNRYWRIRVQPRRSSTPLDIHFAFAMFILYCRSCITGLIEDPSSKLATPLGATPKVWQITRAAKGG